MNGVEGGSVNGLAPIVGPSCGGANAKRSKIENPPAKGELGVGVGAAFKPNKA